MFSLEVCSCCLNCFIFVVLYLVRLSFQYAQTGVSLKYKPKIVQISEKTLLVFNMISKLSSLIQTNKKTIMSIQPAF